jgi:hypothetical protein
MSLVTPGAATRDLWAQLGQDPVALGQLTLTGSEPALPSSFAVGTAAQATLAACGLAAGELRHLRGLPRQDVRVDMRHAAAECMTHYTVNGVAPSMWDKVSGLYPCGPSGAGGWVRIHANFAHHRDGALALLGCAVGEGTPADAVRTALGRWDAVEFEQAAAERGLVVTALRTFEAWDLHPQAVATNNEPLVRIERIAEAPPRPLAPASPEARPLDGLRVLDLTRILAGPVGARALAAYGADVLLAGSPHRPQIALEDTSRGKRSAHIDLDCAPGRAALDALLPAAHVFMQAYRPGSLDARGYGPAAVAACSPGIVYGSLSAYGANGPWASRRGFDSLVQTAMGFNAAEAEAAGAAEPKPLPVQILDHATGYLFALGIQTALARQWREGGSWHVRVSLARTGEWLRTLGRQPGGFAATKPALEDLLESTDSGFGRIVAVRHSVQLAQTPARWVRTAEPPGTHAATWDDPG